MIKHTFISKFFFILASLFIATLIQPIGKNLVYSSLISLLISVIIILIEIEAKKRSFSSLIGSTIGAILGITGAVIISTVITIQDSSVLYSTTKLWMVISLLFSMGYLGIAIGGEHGIAHKFLTSKEALQSTHRLQYLILDTSAIIDGRIADIAEVGFINGKFVISQFVLKELQQVADSQDSGKRSRGRRGLDILHRLQKNKNIDIDITEVDFQDIREVDLKLIELAKQLGGKIITNDFNLNKVAQLRGVQVLNINELANALRPVVLPGETMHVFIFKEGKEYSQGVAYLDDGTMVVVDNARSKIGQTVNINVTSVLQTTAGKMIFGRVADENSLRPDISENSREPRSEKPDRQNLPRPITPS